MTAKKWYTRRRKEGNAFVTNFNFVRALIVIFGAKVSYKNWQLNEIIPGESSESPECYGGY
jgi:hypothetical protein